MKDFVFTIAMAAAGSTYYVPVPCRGIVKSARVACDQDLVATGTITISRGASAVNLLTAPTGDISAGAILDGVRDSTNKDLVFDPASSTAANRVLKIVNDATLLAAEGQVAFHIEYDESAAVKQTASEA